MRFLLAVLVACEGGDRPRRDRDPPDTGTTSTFEPGLPVDVRVGQAVVCDDPAARDTRVFDQLLLDDEPEKAVWHWGGGLAVADLDGDGLHDLFLPGFYGARLYLGTPDGGFVEASERLPPLLAGGSGATAADYDGDGDLDLLETRFIAFNRLLRNDGGTFTDVTEAAGLSLEPRRSVPSSWADLDRDGDLDLWIGNYGHIDQSGADPDHATFEPAEPDFLYLNDGDGTFTDVSAAIPEDAHHGYTLAGGFHDLDRDGWPDLYVVNDFGKSYPNRMLWNREGTLVPDDGAHGLDVTITGMGLGVGDLNDDGLDDLAMSAWDGNSLLLSGAGGEAWFEWAPVLGPDNDNRRRQKIGWGLDLADLDLDGDLDLPMAYGWLDSDYQAPQEQPDALYLRGEDGVFTDVGTAWGVDQATIGRAMVPVDLDRDGHLDLVRRDLSGGPTLVDVSRCGTGAWLTIRLRQPGPNGFAVGARVRVVDRDAGWDRTVLAGGTNYASGGPPEVLFGLGDRDRVGHVEVRWPDGEVSRFGPVDTRRVIEVVRP